MRDFNEMFDCLDGVNGRRRMPWCAAIVRMAGQIEARVRLAEPRWWRYHRVAVVVMSLMASTMFVLLNSATLCNKCATLCDKCGRLLVYYSWRGLSKYMIISDNLSCQSLT